MWGEKKKQCECMCVWFFKSVHIIKSIIIIDTWHISLEIIYLVSQKNFKS